MTTWFDTDIKSCFTNPAKKAGVSKGTCYQYFSNKEDLFLATIDRTGEKLILEVETRTRDIEDILDRSRAKGLIFLSEYRNLQFMFFGVLSKLLSGRLNLKEKEKAKEFYERMAEFIATEIDKGIEQGVFRPIDAKAVAYALMGFGIIAAHRGMIDDDFDALQFFMGIRDFILHGISEDAPA